MQWKQKHIILHRFEKKMITMSSWRLLFIQIIIIRLLLREEWQKKLLGRRLLVLIIIMTILMDKQSTRETRVIIMLFRCRVSISKLGSSIKETVTCATQTMSLDKRIPPSMIHIIILILLYNILMELRSLWQANVSRTCLCVSILFDFHLLSFCLDFLSFSSCLSCQDIHFRDSPEKDTSDARDTFSLICHFLWKVRFILLLPVFTVFLKHRLQFISFLSSVLFLEFHMLCER